MPSIDITKLMTPDEARDIGIYAMTEAQQQAMGSWGLRLFQLNEIVVADIDEVKYDGRLILLGERKQVGR